MFGMITSPASIEASKESAKQTGGYVNALQHGVECNGVVYVGDVIAPVAGEDPKLDICVEVKR